MKERPILFNGEMVRAILEGQKSQTRRVVKPQPDHRTTRVSICRDQWMGTGPSGNSVGTAQWDPWHRSPFAEGDKLWVRESFWAYGRWETRFSEKKGRDEWHFVDLTHECDRIYQFGDPTPDARRNRASATPAWWQRPSIHMPRRASRILLEVTGIRVERLQEISEVDARAEGISCVPFRPDDGWPICDGYMVGADDGKTPLTPTAAGAYRRLWESIHGADQWNANPWVWVIEFKRIEV